MAPPTVVIEKNGAVPVIDVHVGQAQLGTYFVFLWRPRAELVRNGHNDDEFEDRFPVAASVSEVDGRQLSWQIAIQGSGDPNETYHARVMITQGGTTVFMVTYPKTPGEKLNGAKLIVEAVRFQAS